jgi:hypothetical protein
MLAHGNTRVFAFFDVSGERAAVVGLSLIVARAFRCVDVEGV